MGNYWTRLQTPSPDHNSDLEWRGASTKPKEEEERLITDGQCVIRESAGNVYIVAPTGSNTHKEVEKVVEFLYSDPIGIHLSNFMKKYSLEQLQLGGPDEMIINEITSTDEEIEEEIANGGEDNKGVYNRKRAEVNREKPCSRLNLLTLYVTEYHKFAMKRELTELENLRAENEALRRQLRN